MEEARKDKQQASSGLAVVTGRNLKANQLLAACHIDETTCGVIYSTSFTRKIRISDFKDSDIASLMFEASLLTFV